MSDLLTNPVACPKCKTATILHPVVAESTGFVQPYRLRRCPTCDWQQYENISRAEQAEAMRDRAVPPTEAVDLKTCPFCGVAADGPNIDRGYDDGLRGIWIECPHCLANMDRLFGAGISDADGAAVVAQLWNRRPSPEPDGRLAKAAELLREVRAYDSHRDNTLACEFTAEGWIEERDEWLASLSTTKGEKA